MTMHAASNKLVHAFHNGNTECDRQLTQCERTYRPATTVAPRVDVH
jgi:hypothetical protein